VTLATKHVFGLFLISVVLWVAQATCRGAEGRRSAREPSLEKRPSILWRSKAGGRFWFNSPLVRGGLVYCGCRDGRLYAVDIATGKQRWAFKARDETVSCYLATDGRRIFFGSYDGYVYAVDMGTGKVIWRTRFGRMGTGGSPCLAGNLVVFGGQEVAFSAFNVETGQIEWRSDLGRKYFWNCVSDGRIICGGASNRLYCVDAETGKALWSHPIKSHGDWYGGVALWQGKVYYVEPAGADTACVARETASGKEVWRCKAGKYVAHAQGKAPVVKDGKVYVFMGDLYAIHGETGKILWQSKFDSFSGALSWPVAAGGVILAGTTKSLVAISEKTGKRLWEIPTGSMVWSRPAVGNGRVYFGCDDACLYCLGYDEAKPGKRQIPMWGPISLRKEKGWYMMRGRAMPGRPSLEIHGRHLYALIPRGNDLRVGRLDFEGKKLMGTFEIPGATSVLIPRNGHLVAGGPGLPLTYCDLQTGKVLRKALATTADISPGMFGHLGDIGLAYVGRDLAQPEWLVGFELDTGKQLWKNRIEEERGILEVTGNTGRHYWTTSPKAVMGGREKGVVVALDAHTGKTLWRTTLLLETTSTAMEHQGTLYVGCEAAGLRYCPVYAIDAETGKVRWQVLIGGGYAYVVSADAVKLYVISAPEGRLLALDRKNGNILWSAAGFTSHRFQPLPATPHTRPLLLLKDDITLVAIDRTSGEVVSQAVFDERVLTFRASDQIGYVRTEKDNVWVVDLGRVK